MAMQQKVILRRLCAHKEAADEMKSDQRDKYAAVLAARHRN